MKLFSTNNTKLKRDNIISFGIPAFRSKAGFKTCPMAGSCATGCYARQGFFVMPSVVKAQEARLAATKSAHFIMTALAELRKLHAKGYTTVRVHDSGDFYSAEYLDKWLLIAGIMPEMRFYAYTKMVDMVRSRQNAIAVPDNFTIIYSYGGKEDHLIRSTDRHSKVFDSHAAMTKAGYADTTEHDTGAFGANHKVGLVYHGAKSKAFSAVGA